MSDLWGDSLEKTMEWYDSCTFVKIHKDNLTEALSWCVIQKGLSNPDRMFSEDRVGWGWTSGKTSDEWVFHFENDREFAMLFKLTWA